MSWAECVYCWSNGIPRGAFRRRVAELCESDRWSADRIVEEQLRLLRDVVRHAAANVAYYRDAYAQAGIRADEIETLDALSRLPILRRRDLMCAGDRMRGNVDAREVRYYRSSGSSGQPVRTAHDAGSRLSIWALRERAVARYGLHAWSRHALIGPVSVPPMKRLAHRMTDRAFSRTRMNVRDFERASIHATCRRVGRFRPELLIGQPSHIVHIAHAVREAGIDLRGWGTRVVLTIGEGLSAAMERSMAEAFGASVLNEYGCTEVGSIGHRCPAGTIHLNPEHCVVEIVDQAGRAAPPNAPGEVLITALRNGALPLLRYAVGDVAVRARTDCSCGRQPGFPGLASVEGRVSDVWRGPRGEFLSPGHWLGDAQAALAGAGFRESQFVQLGPRIAEVRLTPNERPPESVVESLRHLLAALLGEDAELRWTGAPVKRAPSGKLAALLREAGEGMQDAADACMMGREI